jgi:hypothetical protein
MRYLMSNGRLCAGLRGTKPRARKRKGLGRSAGVVTNGQPSGAMQLAVNNERYVKYSSHSRCA